MTPKPRTAAAPSKRVYVAFAVAAAIGVVVFLIWWLPAQRAPQTEGASSSPSESPQPSTPSPAAGAPRVEMTLPRGGSLSGWSDAPALGVEYLTHAPLVRVDRRSDEVEGWLAGSWKASPDNLIYTLVLRPGLVKADGAPLTAEEAVAAVGEVQTPAGPIALRAVDPQTIDVRFPAPFAPGLRVLADRAVPGMGPFVEPSAGRGSAPRAFARNPHYFRRAPDGSALPYLDELVLVAPGPQLQDFADAPVKPDEMESLRKLESAGKVRVFDLGAGLDVDALWLSPLAGLPSRGGAQGQGDRPWLASREFRLAISAAIDRRAYCAQVFFGACDPVGGPVSPANLSWFNPDLPITRGSVDLARAMLEELGLRDRTGNGVLNDAALRPVRFSLAIRNDVPSAARAAAFLADTLKPVGVQVEVMPLAPAALRARRQKGNYDAMYDRIEFRSTDPAMNLDFWLSTGAAHVWNPARPSPPADWERQLDELMLRNAAIFDRAERLQAFVDAQKIYQQHMPAIFFGVPHVRIATSVRTLNAAPSILRPHVLWAADELAALKPRD